MAAWKTYSFRSKSDMDEFLNGIVRGSVDLRTGADLDAKTLIVDVGAGNVTVTFAPALGRLWTPDEIRNKIETSLPSYPKLDRVMQEAGIPTQVFLKLTKDTAVTVRSTGTGNAALGFSITADTVGRHFVSTEVLDTHVQWGGKWEWHLVTLV